MINKTIIFSIIYCIFITLTDNLKLFKDYKYEPFKFFNYIVWFTLSLISYFNKDISYELIKFCSASIFFNFFYESFFHPEDFWHNIHHYLTNLSIAIVYFNSSIKNPYIFRIVNIYYLAFLSSIFSSLRKLIKVKYGLNHINTMISYNFYKLSYIISKSWGIVMHYKIVYNGINTFGKNEMALVYISIIIHLLQLFFIKKMIK